MTSLKWMSKCVEEMIQEFSETTGKGSIIKCGTEKNKNVPKMSHGVIEIHTLPDVKTESAKEFTTESETCFIPILVLTEYFNMFKISLTCAIRQ